MVASCIIGAQWGDEGKGKVIDLLAEGVDFVVRYSGGNNAGHTVVIGDQRYALHLLPSGILRDNIVNVLAGGVVIDPWHLVSEIEKLRAVGIRVEPGENLLISNSAHLILPHHRLQDQAMEELRGKGKIGTTGRGIGPAYQDRANRSGLRFGDLADPGRLAERLRQVVGEKNLWLEPLGQDRVDVDELLPALLETVEVLWPAGCDTSALLRRWLREDRAILFEGAQGLMLDVDIGTYPYVTSCSVGLGGVASAGVSPRAIDRVILVAKAYTTRVGEGPLPTELHDETGQRIRDQGHEYGTTTGRPRRCGWLDAVALRYACEASGGDELYLTNLDVLSGFDVVRVGTSYEIDGESYEVFPAGSPKLDTVRVQYEDLPGWDEDITGCRSFTALPAAAQAYVDFLEKTIGVAIPLVSVGPGRDQVIPRNRG